MSAVIPDRIDVLVITTLIGGTIGGYITYAGAHRMLDSGVVGPANVRQITQSSILGIIVTGVIRLLLFLAVIAVSVLIHLLVGQAPTTLLIAAGAVNGLILPVGFAVILWVAWRRRDLLAGYAYPRWLLVIDVLARLLTLFLGYRSLSGLAKLWA